MLALSPAPLAAQAVVQPIGVSEADRLAEQVRRLGANPRDLDALLAAAELSIALEDLSAAGSFLARADRISPGSPRGLAVRAAILVRTERPGEALRLFTQAEGAGWPAARLAGDRGLAFDLVGEQRRAQADYRLAMRAGDGSDEVRRRLALSLAISGKEREALDELSPLVRRNDRGAWRARAFVLAMGGDVPEALKIAQTMMPPGSAQGLQSFFVALPALPAVDRAFAVHFGQVRPTAERLADARLAPYLAPLPPEPVQVATVVPAPQARRERGRRSRSRSAQTPMPVQAPVQVAAAETLPPPPAYRAPLYPTPSYTPPVYGRPSSGSVLAASATNRPLTPGEQASLAAATLPSARGGRSRRGATPPPVDAGGRASLATAAAAVVRPVQLDTAPVRPRRRTPVQVAAATPSAPTRVPDRVAALDAPAGGSPASGVVVDPDAPFADAGAAPVLGTVMTVVPSPSVPAAATEVAPQGLATVAEPATAPASNVVSPAPVVVRPPVRVSRTQADNILAKIVANLSIPASELGVSGPASGRRAARTADAPAPARRTAKAVAATERKADVKATVAAKGGTKANTTKAAANHNTPTDKRLAAGRRSAKDKTAAAENRDSRAMAEKTDRKGSRAEPARIWVQVAGGANEGDLDKAWQSVRAKAPAAFKGRQGYTAPLRATNRVLTGPFKTDSDARAYVNQLSKRGVSAFTVRSEAGQKVSRLDAK